MKNSPVLLLAWRSGRYWLLAIRAAPVAALLFGGALAILVACACSRQDSFLYGPYWENDTPTAILLQDGELRITCWINLPVQDLYEDGWYIGGGPLEVSYSGTYQPPGYLNMHGVNYRLSLPLWLIGIGLLIFNGIALFRAVRGCRRQSGVLCAACGYDLTGNVSGRCPECGTECGNAGRGNRKRTARRRWMRAAGFAIVMPMIGLVVLALLDFTVIPAIVWEETNVVLEPPASSGRPSITMRFLSMDWYLPGTHTADTPWEYCDIRLGDDEHNYFLVYLDRMFFYMQNDEQKDLSAEALLARLAELGLDANDEHVAVEAETVYQLIVKAVDPRRPFAKGGKFSVYGGSSSDTDRRVLSEDAFIVAAVDTSVFEETMVSYGILYRRIGLFHELILLFGVATWLYGIGRILRGRRGKRSFGNGGCRDGG